VEVDEALSRLFALERQVFHFFVERRKGLPSGMDHPTRLQMHVLAAILDRGGMYVSEVADLLGTGIPAASQLLGSLEARGWCRREMSVADRRRHRVTVSPAGQELVQAGRRRRREQLAALLGALTPKEREQLVGLAERMAQLASQLEAVGEGPPLGGGR
jgi:DNA-binding MarR family transcriptional regulator